MINTNVLTLPVPRPTRNLNEKSNTRKKEIQIIFHIRAHISVPSHRRKIKKNDLLNKCYVFLCVFLLACSGWGQSSARVWRGGIWERWAGRSCADRDGPNPGGRTGGPSVTLYPWHLREKHLGCTHCCPGYGEYVTEKAASQTHHRVYWRERRRQYTAFNVTFC